jgi:hypothetical protein
MMMAACEKCWRDAILRALMLGGSVADHYSALLDERRDNPCPQPPPPDVDGGHLDQHGLTKPANPKEPAPGVSGEALRALVERWRNMPQPVPADESMHMALQVRILNLCADELEAALALLREDQKETINAK